MGISRKEIILDTALSLFNEKGVREVTTRDISEAMEISQGNLTYHFKKKEQIIEALYLRLTGEMDNLFESFTETPEISVEGMYLSCKTVFSVLQKYRFFMIDFVQLMRDQPSIKKHFQELMNLRQQQFGLLFQGAQLAGILNPPQFPQQYELLMRNLSIQGDYWMSHAEIVFQGSMEEALTTYTKSFMLNFFPYFSEEARRELQQLLFN